MTYLSLHLIANITLELVYENAPECTVFKWGIAPSPGHTPPPRHLDPPPPLLFDKSNTDYIQVLGLK